MKKVFDEHFKEQYVASGLLKQTGGDLMHLISDAATTQIIRWTGGGFGMACHNYDGDMLTDEVAQVHRSPGFIASNLWSSLLWVWPVCARPSHIRPWVWCGARLRRTFPLVLCFAWVASVILILAVGIPTSPRSVVEVASVIIHPSHRRRPGPSRSSVSALVPVTGSEHPRSR